MKIINFTHIESEAIRIILINIVNKSLEFTFNIA